MRRGSSYLPTGGVARGFLAAALLGVLLPLARPAIAVDGVIEINQAKALAGGVTTSDALGFPVTIDSAGSYRLTSNLVVTDPNQDAISLLDTISDVTIDLNGFVVAGPSTCSGDPLVCGPGGTGNGIYGPNAHFLTVTNGTVRGFPGHGVFTGYGGRVDGVHAEHNGYGIQVAVSSVVANCTTLFNQTGIWGQTGNVIDSTAAYNVIGISVSGSSVLKGVNARGNQVVGIRLSSTGSTVSNSSSLLNGAEGILCDESCSLTGNMVNGNGGHGIQVAAGSTVSNSSSSNNGGNGIHCTGSCSLTQNSVAANTGKGIEVPDTATVSQSSSSNNGAEGIHCTGACQVSHSSVSANANTGIRASYGSTISNNVSKNNGDRGIRCYGECSVTYNSVVKNGSHGIQVAGGSTLSNNVCFDNDDSGIFCEGRCALAHNSLTANEGDSVAGTHARFTAGNVCDDGLCSSDGRRLFYLSKGPGVVGGDALGVCTPGYHMASIWEIQDPTELKYNTRYGQTRGDSGEGPPNGVRAWVRTGADASGGTEPGRGNCLNWTQSTSQWYGSVVSLNDDWFGEEDPVDPWNAGWARCDVGNRVWCIQDD